MNASYKLIALVLIAGICNGDVYADSGDSTQAVVSVQMKAGASSQELQNQFLETIRQIDEQMKPSAILGEKKVILEQIKNEATKSNTQLPFREVMEQVSAGKLQMGTLKYILDIGLVSPMEPKFGDTAKVDYNPPFISSAPNYEIFKLMLDYIPANDINKCIIRAMITTLC